MMLLHFFHEIEGLCEFGMEEKILDGGQCSKHATTSYEAFVFFAIRDYDKMHKKK